MKKTIPQRIRTAFIYWLARRLPDCKALTPTIGQSIDRKLSFRERVTVRLHLFTCSACTRYIKQVRFLSDAVRVHEQHLDESAATGAAALSTEAKNRFKRMLGSSNGLAF